MASVAAGAASLGGLPSLAFAKAQGAKKPMFKGQTLRVFVYSGAWEKAFREEFVPRFEAMTGARVVVDPGWWDSIPKLKASPKGHPAFDLVLTDGTQGYPAIKEGMFQKIDMTRIPNRLSLVPSVLNNWVYTDGYGITFPESAMTLAYNKNMLKFTPTSWADLLRDDVKGKVGLYNSFYMSLYTFACMKVAHEGKPGTAAREIETNLNSVITFAKEHRDAIKYWWPTSTDMALNLVQRNTSIGNIHSSDILPAMAQKPELGAIVPDADRAFVQFMWVIPVGTQRKDLAEEAINFIFSEDMQTAFAVRGQATANLASAKIAAAKNPFWKQIYPSTTEQLAKVAYYPYDAYTKNWDVITKAWDESILRKGHRS